MPRRDPVIAVVVREFCPRRCAHFDLFVEAIIIDVCTELHFDNKQKT
jgi:hypothetical protein